MGNQTVEQKVKLHPLESGYLLVDLNGNDRFDGRDYIVVDKNDNGKDDPFGDTVVVIEDLNAKLMKGTNLEFSIRKGTNLEFSIRNCPVDTLNSLLSGSTHRRAEVIKSTRIHQKLCDEYIKEAIHAAQGEELYEVGTGRRSIGEIDEAKVNRLLAAARDEAGEACVPWPHKAWEVYATLSRSYQKKASDAPKDGTVDVSELKEKADQNIKKAEETRKTLLPENDIYLDSAIACAGHGDPKCMKHYLYMVCEKNFACFKEKELPPDQMVKLFESEKDYIKGLEALRLLDQWNKDAKKMGYK